LRYFNVDRELRTLLVASAAPGDGKTTVARHLAAAAARMGARVLLLEADLRRPTVAQQLDVLSGPGVFLAVSLELMSFTRITVRADQMGGVPCIRGLRIPVATVVGMVADGMSDQEILAAYPDLEAEDIREAMRYAAEAVHLTSGARHAQMHSES
jgi:uncharacterized protein (DUF433 family)